MKGDGLMKEKNKKEPAKPYKEKDYIHKYHVVDCQDQSQIKLLLSKLGFLKLQASSSLCLILS